MLEATASTFFAPLAWVEGRLQRNVRLTAQDGTWHSVEAEASAEGCELLAGLVLPGLVNAHSHAFQRAMAGMAEHRAAHGDADADDDFWSWREQMYRVALRISPEQLEAVATQLYSELLAGGSTQVCEFHYLHNDVNGMPYADSAEMALAIVRAAQHTGIGLTLLPALYMHAGFGPQALREQQRRFASTPQSVMRVAERVQSLHLPHINAGLALHSLRAVGDAALREVAGVAQANAWPIHIHISEQTQEVQACLTQHGKTPIAHLMSEVPLDARWNLVHATHATPAELQALAGTSANVVLCPSTEANLGDGVFDLPGWLRLSGAWCIGSDSHVTRSVPEELRLLEYSQRFVQRQRNVAAKHAGGRSSAAALLGAALAGGSAACGQPLAGIARGQRADFCVLNANAAALQGVPTEHLLDALLFSSPAWQNLQTWVGGRCVWTQSDGLEHPTNRFSHAMKGLWAEN